MSALEKIEDSTDELQDRIKDKFRKIGLENPDGSRKDITALNILLSLKCWE